MKVVLFCGGLGMRMRALTPDNTGNTAQAGTDLPKPMVHIGGQRPLIWHIMKYYGHKDFILCLGYRGETIKNYFLNYSEYLTNDFTLSGSAENTRLMNSDIHDWNITFIDTGINSNVGQRLYAVKDHLKDEDYFIANYADGLSDLPHDEYQAAFTKTDKTAAFVCVTPPHTNHVVNTEADGSVTSISPIRSGHIRINGGYFIFKQEIFDHMQPGEELVEAPFKRLIKAKQLYGHQYDGFWTCLDTFKEKQQLDESFLQGDTPWQVWQG